MGNSPVVVWNKLHSFKAPSPIEKGISYLLCQKVHNVAQKRVYIHLIFQVHGSKYEYQKSLD